jgi:O-antigen/teichoic acid export membrane protein
MTGMNGPDKHSPDSNLAMEKLVPGQLTHVATSGAFWNIGLAVANKAFTLIGQVVLAWILTPKDMGLAGMATAMAGIVAFMNASGVCDVLIQRGRYKEEAGQGLWLSFFLSFSTALLVACLVPIASWMGRPELSKMLFILAFLPIVDALSPVLAAALKSDLNFKRFAFSAFLGGVTYTLCAVVLAAMGFGAYSLILSVIPRSLVIWISMLQKTGMPHFERPRFHFIKKLIRPSLSISLTSFLNALQQQVPIFCVGLVTNLTVTGHFSWGWQVASQAVFLLAVNLRQVLMPILSKISHDPERQAVATFRAVRAITALLMVACGFQALIAPALLIEFFPEKWDAAGPVITWISVGLIFQGVNVCFSSWLNAAGRYRDLLVVTALPVVLGSGLAYGGALIQGAEGASWGIAFGLFLSAVFSLYYMPFKVLKAQIKMFAIPFLISCAGWTIFYFFCSIHKSLAINVICSLLFLCISLFSWLLWGGEQFRDLLNAFIEKFKLNSTVDKSKKEEALDSPAPNFFIIGAPKCGTTALSEYLRGNPGVFISSPKEPEYFSTDLSAQFKMSRKTYLSLYSKADPKIHKAIGEASTAYLFSKRAVDEILKFNPKAKFIVMVRNPIELVQALHSQMLFQGIETVLGFEEAWRLESQRKVGKRIPFFCYDKNSVMYSEWGKLGEQVERLLMRADRKKVKIILFDDFVKNTKKTYEEALAFLEVPSDGQTEFPKINENRNVILPLFQPILGLPVKAGKALRALTGFPRDLGFFLNLLFLNGRISKKNNISEEFKNELIEFYRGDIKKLSKLIRRDLSIWTSKK